MYSKFKYTPTHYFYNKELNPHLEKGKEIFKQAIQPANSMGSQPLRYKFFPELILA